MNRRYLFVLLALAATQAAAQTNVGTVRECPFVPRESRIYDEKGAFAGMARGASIRARRSEALRPRGARDGYRDTAQCL